MTLPYEYSIYMWPWRVIGWLYRVLRQAMKSSALLVFLLAAVPALAQASFSVPIHATPQGNALYIEAKLNGHPAILVLDTGSTFSECDIRICGKVHKAMASLSIGQWSDASHEVTTRDFAEVSKQAGIKVDGILGLLTMHQFQKVTFNFAAAQLEITAR